MSGLLNHIRFSFLSLLLLAYLSGFALDVSLFKFKTLDIKDGLSQNSINYIFQGSKGYMWFCTNEGLNLYNGYSFEVFKNQIDNSNSLVSNFTQCMAETDNGVFWIGTERGISVFMPDKKIFVNTESPLQIKRIIAEDDKAVWVQTNYSVFRAELVQIGKKGLSPKDYAINIKFYYDYDEILYKDNEGKILLSSKNDLLYNYVPKSKTVVLRSSSKIWATLSAKKINSVVQDNQFNYWIATNSGVFKCDKNFNDIDTFSANRKKLPALQGKINDLSFDKAGNIYMATSQNGLIIYDAKQAKFYNYQYDIFDLTGLPDNKLLSVLVDKSQTLWVGTKGAGISAYSPFKYKFKLITQEPFKTSWLTNKYILAIEKDKSGNVWIGTDGGGLFRYDVKKNLFTNWRNNSAFSSLSNDVVQDILIDKKGILWIGTLNGICKFLPSGNNFIRYYFTANNVHENLTVNRYSNIRLFEKSNGELYAFDDNNIYKFNAIRQEFDLLNIMYYSRHFIPRFITEDDDGTLWIASNAGIYHLNTAEGFMDIDALKKLNEKYFKNGRVYGLLKEDADRYWVATGNNGIYLFNKKTFAIEVNYTEKSGLSNNYVYSILKDNSGKLWMSTNRGISVFDPISKTFKNYDVNDGLQSNEFNGGAFLKTYDDEIYFGGVNGFNIIQANEVPFNAYKPSSNIISVKANDVPVDFDRYSQHPKRVKFSNDQDNIEFEFSSSDYANPPKNMFQYKLEGYDKNWTTSNRNYVKYAKLPHGNYTLLVRASNNDAVWSDNISRFEFRIKPMFWQTILFRILFIIVALFFLYRFIKNTIRSARMKEIEKARKEKQKTIYEKQLAEIKLKALVAQMNPHFIFNCMNSIQAMILSDKNMEASTYLTKLSRLVRAVLENSVKTFIPLSEIIENLKLYLELESLRFDKKFHYDLKVENLDIYSVEMPSMLFQPYVENAIWHGLLKKEGEKNLQIHFFKRDNYCICEITDNGIGRTKAAELNLKKQHKSLGTVITKDMFETLHKIRDSKYTVDIIDLYDEQNEAAGTKVKIEIEIN